MGEKLKHRILVVDDDESTRECLATLLTSHGYEVSTAEDGFDALLQLTREPPDVLISDLNMPGMSGFELLPVVRRVLPRTMLIAMSGAYEGEAIPEGVTADAFVAKGEHPERLLSTTAHLIRSSAALASN